MKMRTDYMRTNYGEGYGDQIPGAIFIVRTYVIVFG